MTLQSPPPGAPVSRMAALTAVKCRRLAPSRRALRMLSGFTVRMYVCTFGRFAAKIGVRYASRPKLWTTSNRPRSRRKRALSVSVLRRLLHRVHSLSRPNVSRRAVVPDPGAAQSVDLVAASREAVGQVGDDALDAAVVPRRHRNERIHDEQHAHQRTAPATAASSAPRSSGCSQCQRRSAAARAAQPGLRRAAPASDEKRGGSAASAVDVAAVVAERRVAEIASRARLRGRSAHDDGHARREVGEDLVGQAELPAEHRPARRTPARRRTAAQSATMSSGAAGSWCTSAQRSARPRAASDVSASRYDGIGRARR